MLSMSLSENQSAILPVYIYSLIIVQGLLFIIVLYYINYLCMHFVFDGSKTNLFLHLDKIPEDFLTSSAYHTALCLCRKESYYSSDISSNQGSITGFRENCVICRFCTTQIA